LKPFYTFTLLVSLATAISALAQSSAEPPGQAANYAAAAASYRQAAAKTQSAKNRTCYNAWADYYDCVVQTFRSGSRVRCSEPTCAYEKESENSTSTSAAAPNKQFEPQTGSSTETAFKSLIAKYQDRFRRELGEIGRGSEQGGARDAYAERRTGKAADVLDKLGGVDLEELPEEKKPSDTSTTNKSVVLVPFCNKASRGGAPAFPSFGKDYDEWSPWLLLNQKGSDASADGIEWAFWTMSQMPCGSVCNTRGTWTIRNSTPDTVRVRYRVFVVRVGIGESSDWRNYDRTLKPNTMFTEETMWLFQIGCAELISMEIVPPTTRPQ
jgi:hypothetical protein